MEQITRLQGERGVAARLRPGGPHYLHPEIQAIRFDWMCDSALPGEFFVETRGIFRPRRDPHLLIACYANHHGFYVVPRRSSLARVRTRRGNAGRDAEETLRAAAIAYAEIDA